MTYYKINFKNLVIKWLIGIVSLFLVIKIIKGLEITVSGLKGFFVLLITSAVIGLINTFIRPILLLVTLPLSIFTFGIFTVILNGLLFSFAGFLVPGFKVTSFLGAIVGSLLFSFISFLCNLLIISKNEYKENTEHIHINYRIIE